MKISFLNQSTKLVIELTHLGREERSPKANVAEGRHLQARRLPCDSLCDCIRACWEPSPYPCAYGRMHRHSTCSFLISCRLAPVPPVSLEPCREGPSRK